MELEKRRRYGVKAFLILLSALPALIFSCSFPKLRVLKDPLSPEEHLNLGVAYEKGGEIDLALKEYEKAAKKLPLALLYLGNAYFLKNRWEEAEVHYRKAIEKDPGNADAHNNLAWLYYCKGENLEEAEALARKALALDPSKEPVYRDTLEKIKEKGKFTH